MTNTTDHPPVGLVEAQQLAIRVAEEACRTVKPMQTEAEVRDLVDDLVIQHGGVGVWTPTTVGFGIGTLSCFPTDKPSSERFLWNLDLGTIDVHPITKDGWWGDCTRSFQVGDNPAQLDALKAVDHIHETLLRSARPGMRASEWYAIFRKQLEQTPYVALDRLSNIGHSLANGTSYDEGYIDAWNGTVMTGAWAVEPFIGNHLYGTKREDVVWFGDTQCTIIR